ncbi:MAG: polyhydroxyalkanoic acid synthase, PhaR subunit [Bacillales bacterium]|jgi:polyhydroxyalkanoic acid synthase PhaR subunit|nr:polyhydroxyalkanoic acid synthase, PhaR subunit [Bacillales bacterium]
MTLALLTNGGDCMFDTRNLDPYKVWKDMYDNSEKYWGKVLNETMAKEEYAKWMSSLLDMNLFFNKWYQDATKVYFESSQVPTKEDFSRIAKLVINVEDKVDHLEDLLEGITDTKNNDELDMKVSKLEKKIATLEEALIQISQLTKIQSENVSLLNSIYTSSSSKKTRTKKNSNSEGEEN